MSNLYAKFILGATLFAWVSLTGGCSTSGGGPAPEVTESIAEPATNLVADLKPGWNEINPGEPTICSDGSPYRFFVRPGATDKLMVYMQGGGACWFRQNCDPEMQPTYTIRIAEGFRPSSTGIFNFDNPDNPFADYSIVMAPYCTGDVHLGASDTVYPPAEEGQEPLTIHHQGRRNMQAVLDWVTANVPEPDRVFVTGSSAGAIPSPLYASILADLYPDARVAQLGDGAGGYRRINADTRPDQQWGTFNFLNSEPGFADVGQEGFNYEKLYIAAAKANPDILFAEYDAAEDDVQKRFLALGGSETASLLDALQANHADIRAEADNFRAIIVGGASHTVLLRPEFYSYGVGNTSVRDWVAGLENFEEVADVTCSECAADTYAGPPLPGAMSTLWNNWEDPAQQYVAPFQIFDNLYYVGIDWVAAYVLETSDGLILIDSLYGKWVPQLLRNMTQLGLNPADIKYIINTHGHFDHAGGSGLISQRYGARIVMSEEDWALAKRKPDLPQFYMYIPERDIVANDGDAIVLGDTRVDLFKTPGHTEGVLSLRYPVRDGEDTHTAITLGGVGLNFSGVARTESYLASYARLTQLQQGVAVSLPNHAAMGGVFQKGALLAERGPDDPHPFVDEAGFAANLRAFINNAQAKLVAEKAGTAPDPMAELTKVLDDDN